MEKQQYPQKVLYPGSVLYPAEGRVDVAGDVEEEQRNAYVAHHKVALARGKEVIQKSEGESASSLADFNQATLPPVEGRVDVAGDVEEEWRNAYSAHHV